MDVYLSQENIKKILNKGLSAVKTPSKTVVHKGSEFIGNKIEDTVTKSNDHKVVKQEPVEEIINPLEKIDEIINRLKKVF